MADIIKKQVVIEGEFDGTKAEKDYARVIKKIQEPIKLEVDADVKSAAKNIQKIQEMFEKLKDEDGKIKLTVEGIDQINQQLTGLGENLTKLTEHFTKFKSSISVKSEIEKNNQLLGQYAKGIKEITKSKEFEFLIGGDLRGNQRVKAGSPDKFFDKKSVKKYISELYKDLLNGKQSILDNNGNSLLGDSDFKNLIQMMGKLVSQTGSFNKELQISEKESINLADVFEKISISMQNTVLSKGKKGQKLSSFLIDSGVNNDLANLTAMLNSYRHYLEVGDELQRDLNKALGHESSGSINVELNASSIKELADAISELKGAMRIEEGQTIGINTEDVNRITCCHFFPI